jgi:hypothetical protein
MVTFRSNNNRRPPFRSNNNRRPPFRSNNEGSKFSNNSNFQRKVPGRNNHNAPKLIEKYNEMAREALANEDRVLSENYFQHADHFMRVQNEQEDIRMARVKTAPTSVTEKLDEDELKDKNLVETEDKAITKIIQEPSSKKAIKDTEKKIVEKKTVSI